MARGLGTIRAIRDRDGNIRGYRALLPRSYSTPPAGCRNPDDYQEAIGPVFGTPEQARELLNAAIAEIRSGRSTVQDLTLSYYVAREIDERRQTARRDYGSEARAARATATWTSIQRTWLTGLDWLEFQPGLVTRADLQGFANHLRDHAVSRRGQRLSGSFIRNVFGLLSAALDRAEVKPNPASEVTLPRKSDPRIEYLDLSAQRRLLRSSVPLADRVMIGCGMGAGLRVNELLSMERGDVRIDDADPHVIVRYGGPDRAPTKGRRIRRVELFEPGLGFWRLWLERFAPRDELVFAGPRGGYRKEWPESFPGWAEHAGVRRLTSHAMRHSYAVAMLSGSWGYEPRTMVFVSQQLGHRDITTTQRYYAAFEAGTWGREVRIMTGQETRAHARRSPVTAHELLGTGVSGDAQDAGPGGNSGRIVAVPINSHHSPQQHENSQIVVATGAAEHRILADAATAARRALEAIEAGDPRAVALSIDALRLVLEAERALSPVLEIRRPA